MRISRLDIMGFKSFPERIQVAFPAGISAVVGPNGCGKSNIVDAIRWVMGEQSAKQLRGRQMDDIIFNGARTHQQAGMAEVTMVLSNEKGVGPGPTLGPSEISITRRLYRSGDAEYLINRVPCRLKDITQFFMDTGMGTKAYAIIEQGRIGALVDARPEERRALIDEAAGITRYKAQKREAERKMEATEQNLTHLSALMAETKRQINSLTRAARRAARYKELRGELKGLDLALTSLDLTRLEGERTGLAARQEELQVGLTGLLAGLEAIEVDLENRRLEIVEREKESEAKAEAFHVLSSEYNKLQQEGQFLDQQTRENESRQSRLQGEISQLAEQGRQKTEELEGLRVEVSDLLKQEEERKAGLEEQIAVYTDLKQEYDQAEGSRDEAAQRLSEIRSRQARLEEMLAGHDRLARNQEARREEIAAEIDTLQAEAGVLGEQVRAFSREKEDLSLAGEDARQQAAAHQADRAGFRERADQLADEARKVESRLSGLNSRLAAFADIQASFGWYPEAVQALMNSQEMRAAGILGPVAEKLVVPEGYETAVEAALGERLKSIMVKDRQAAASAIEFLKEGRLGRCGFLALSDLGPGAEADLLRALLGDYALAENISEALRQEPGRTVLTRDGDFFGQDGAIVGGRAAEEDRGLLERFREMETLEVRAGEQEAELDRLEGLRREALTQMENIGQALALAEDSARVSEAALMEVEKKLSAANGRRGDIEGRLAAQIRALESQAAEARRLSEEMEAATEQRRRLEDEKFDLTAELEEASEKVARLATELDEVREQGQQARLEMNSITQRRQATERTMTQTRNWLTDIENQIDSKQQELGRAREDIERLAERRQEITGLLDGSADRLAQAQEEVSLRKRLVDEARTGHNEKENEARQARRRRSELDEQIRKVEFSLQEIGFKKQALIDRIQTEYRLNLLELPEGARQEIDPETDLQEAQAHRDDLRSKIEAMGEVNTGAIEEHDALLERYNFYKAQYDDLTAAIENLKNSIARINRTCNIRFKSTFEAVDQKLREIFPLLFEGGEAWLSLTDESNPLDSGVEIHVHPPGKKLTVMSLLSGGEKALVALALIFALYLIKPSPFCLLDETDAPLDEANIDRFNRLLKKLGQSSQIIMVTHNKRTMQISETLYGVTMEVPGVSKMVSVNLSEAEAIQEDAQMVQAG